MKKALLIGLAILLISGVANAQGYIGLYADDVHETQCVNDLMPTPVTYWIWCLPGADDQICAEFDAEAPTVESETDDDEAEWEPPEIVEPPSES